MNYPSTSGESAKAWRWPSIPQALVLMAAAQFSPMSIWVRNVSEIGFPDGLLVLVALIWLASIGLWLLVVRAGMPARSATVSIFYVILGVSMLGARADRFVGGAMSVLLLVVAFCWLVHRVHDLAFFEWFQASVTLFIAVSPVALAIVALATTPESAVGPPPAIPEIEFADTRDVVVIVFDSHGSYPTLREYFPSNFRSQETAIAASGAQIRSGMRANYTLTHLSLASFFEMGLPLGHGSTVEQAEWAELMRIVRGSNSLVEVFKEQDYRFVMVESGWAGFHCTTVVDQCVGGPWPDEPTMLAMERTLFRHQVATALESAPRGAYDTMTWLKEDLSGIVNNDKREFIVAHLMLPHPPLRIGSECELYREAGLGGRTVTSPSFTREEIDKRKTAYIKATECVASSLAGLLEIIQDRALLVAFGDHGPDSQGQLHQAPGEWHQSQVHERLGVLFVTNSTCQMNGVNSLVNVGRWLIGCMAGEDVDYVQERYFVAVGVGDLGTQAVPIHEVTTMVVNEMTRDDVGH